MKPDRLFISSASNDMRKGNMIYQGVEVEFDLYRLRGKESVQQ